MELKEIICSSGSVSKGILSMLGKATFVGIDFGTSTTIVTRMAEENGRVVPRTLAIPQENLSGVWEWNHLVPTVVAMKPDGHLLCGNGAKDCLLVDAEFREGENVWSFCKMRLGESACYPKSKMTRDNTPVAGCVIEEPKDVATAFFKYLKKAIEEAIKKEALPEKIRYVVTVPASFAPNQREELCVAIRAVGMQIDPAAMLDEPNAAFLGALADGELGCGVETFFRGGDPSRILVFDFGAGTCDISILEVTPELEMTNQAISHFTALGGRDLDRKVAENVLYPQLIAGRTGDEVPVKSVREELIAALCPVAEMMKIAICDHYKDDYGAKAFTLAEEEPDFSVPQSFARAVRDYGLIENGELSLSGADFAKIMRGFGEPPKEAFENDRKSIFEPIDNALGKIGLKPDEVDFVLLIGGSCLNPFVRDLMEDYFSSGITQIVPVVDPQILVSEGAAVHALAHYGCGQSVIHPIVSDSIVARTADGNRVVFPAGTPVPANWKKIDGLYIDEQSAAAGLFGIPFLIGAGTREMGVAKFKLPPMESGCPVELSCALSADKLLAYEINVQNRIFSGTLKMPLSNEEVDLREVAYNKAKNELARGALANGGTSSPEQYLAVAKACRDLGKFEEEAEYYRDLMYHHRGLHYEYEAACAYRAAARRKEALAWSRKACAYRMNYLNVWYIIWDLAAVKGWEDLETAEYLERALATWPDDLDLKYVDMKCLEGCGQKDEADARARELCDEWERMGVDTLGEYTLERFEIVARKCGKRNLCVAARRQQELLSGGKDKSKSEENVPTLVRSKNEGGDQ